MMEILNGMMNCMKNNRLFYLLFEIYLFYYFKLFYIIINYYLNSIDLNIILGILFKIIM